MNNDLKQILDQIENIRKSQISLINDSLINSKSAIDSISTLNMYQPNIINTAALMRESIENSKSAMESLRTLDVYTKVYEL